MNSFQIRLWMTAIVTVACYAGTAWVRNGYTFEVVPTARTLTEIPLDLEGWRGTDSPLDQDVLNTLNADETVQRVYVGPDGASLSVNVATWVRPDMVSDVSPHIPSVCYQATGWRIVSESVFNANTPRGTVPIRVMLLDRRDQKLVVGYWYRLGDEFFHTPDEARSIHRKLWGKPKWPALVKVMLQVSSGDVDSAKPNLERFANLIEQQLYGEPQKPGQSS